MCRGFSTSKIIKRHQQDQIFLSLKDQRQFEFISLNCHAELAILKVANDLCDERKTKTLYIGVSKRPCYCCSLFFKAIQENNKSTCVEENKSTKFSISIVTSHGKFYSKWNKIEGFDKEFNQVWAKVVEDLSASSALKKQTPQQTDDNSSESGGSSNEDDLDKIKFGKKANA